VTLILVWTHKQLLMLTGISYAIISLFPRISSTSVLSLFTDCMHSTAQPVNDARESDSYFALPGIGRDRQKIANVLIATVSGRLQSVLMR